MTWVCAVYKTFSHAYTCFPSKAAHRPHSSKLHIAKNKVIHSYNAGRWKEGWGSIHLEMRKLWPRPFMWLTPLQSGTVLLGPCPPHGTALFQSHRGEHMESYIASKHLENLSFDTEKGIQSLYNPQDMHSPTQHQLFVNDSIPVLKIKAHTFVPNLSLSLYKTKMSWAVIVILR